MELNPRYIAILTLAFLVLSRYYLSVWVLLFTWTTVGPSGCEWIV